MARKWLVVLLVAMLQVGIAQANLIQFAFTGAIDNDPFGVFGNTTFAGSYTFDSAMTQVLNTPNTGAYAGGGGIFNMNLSFTGALDPSLAGPYVADNLNITVNNDFSGPLDEYLVTGTSSIDAFLFIELRFDDLTGAVFSDTSLPLTPPNLFGFSSIRFALFDGTLDNPIEGEGALLSLQCTEGCANAVSEPKPMMLLGIALGMLGLARRKPSRLRRIRVSNRHGVRHRAASGRQSFASL